MPKKKKKKRSPEDRQLKVLRHNIKGICSIFFVGFYDISNLVGYLMLNSSFYISIKHTWFGLDSFYGILTIVGYLITNPLSLYIYLYDL